MQPSSPLLAVTFDVTQTLIHSPNLAEIYNEVLHRHGITASLKDLRREIPWVWKEFSCRANHRRDRFSDHPKGARGWWQGFLNRLCDRLAVERPSPFAGAELFERFALADSWEVYSDVEPTLASLRKAGMALGVVSNWDSRLPRLLENLQLTPFFDAVIFSSESGVEKPNPQIFLQCLEALEVEPSSALHIGDDAVEDIEGAIAVGMQALQIDRRQSPTQLLELTAPLLKKAVGETLEKNSEQPTEEDHHVER